MWEIAQNLYKTKLKGLVLKTAKKYLNYSSMDIEDFISDGIIAIYYSLKNICSNCNNFNPSFNCEKFCKDFYIYLLNQMKQHFSQLADIPGECKLGISNSKKPVTYIPISEDFEENNYTVILKSFTHYEEQVDVPQYENISIKNYLNIFTKRELQLFYLLENGKTIEEITSLMGFKHKQGVYVTIQRMLKKIKKLSQKQTTTKQHPKH